jgi:hypothetical protein
VGSFTYLYIYQFTIKTKTMSKKKRKKGFTTKNTHIPKRVNDYLNRTEKMVKNFTDGDYAMLETTLLLKSDEDLWDEFTNCLSMGLYLPFLEEFRKDYLSDKPNLDKPITNVECMLIGVTLRDSKETMKMWLPKMRDTNELLPFTMCGVLKLVSECRDNIPYHNIQRMESNIDWE